MSTLAVLSAVLDVIWDGADVQSGTERAEIVVGVLLAEATTEIGSQADGGLHEEGHTPARGYRGQHTGTPERRVVELGQDVLRAAAEAVGHEVALVIDGVIAGIERRRGLSGRLFAIDDLQLKFGVKATLGTGPAVAALFTAAGEATVEVTVKLREQS